MALPPRNHHITLAAAARMAARWRETAPNEEKGGAFHADQVLGILDQPGCAALRYYHALDDDGKPALILAGVNADGTDMREGILLELNYPCPPFCGEWNELNADATMLKRVRWPFRAQPRPLPPRDHHIALEDAARMTRRFRLRVRGRGKGGAFHADQVRQLLEQPECVALRYYHALDDANKYALVLVGVNREGSDLTDGILLELNYPCPPFCGEFSELNASRHAVEALRRRQLEPALGE